MTDGTGKSYRGQQNFLKKSFLVRNIVWIAILTVDFLGFKMYCDVCFVAKFVFERVLDVGDVTVRVIERNVAGHTQVHFDGDATADATSFKTVDVSYFRF